MEHNESQKPLGRSSLNVPRLGVGAMTWGDAKGLARLHPAKIAYGGAHGRDEEMRALEASLAAGVTLFDTAAMYSGGASELRLGELARGTQALIAYQPLASGALTGKYAGGVKPKGLRRFTASFRGKGPQATAPVVALLREIGERYAKTPAQVALRWLIENDSVLPIPGAKNGAQAADNAGALLFALTPDEIETLNKTTLAWRT